MTTGVTPTMITLEHAQHLEIEALREEVKFLREIVRALAEQDPGVIRHSVTGQEVRRDT